MRPILGHQASTGKTLFYYLKTWWSVVDWEQATHCLDLSDNSTEELWEAEGAPSRDK